MCVTFEGIERRMQDEPVSFLRETMVGLIPITQPTTLDLRPAWFRNALYLCKSIAENKNETDPVRKAARCAAVTMLRHVPDFPQDRTDPPQRQHVVIDEGYEEVLALLSGVWECQITSHDISGDERGEYVSTFFRKCAQQWQYVQNKQRVLDAARFMCSVHTLLESGDDPGMITYIVREIMRLGGEWLIDQCDAQHFNCSRYTFGGLGEHWESKQSILREWRVRYLEGNKEEIEEEIDRAERLAGIILHNGGVSQGDIMRLAKHLLVQLAILRATYWQKVAEGF